MECISDYNDIDNIKESVLSLTDGVVKESADMFFQRVYRKEMWFIYICIVILNVLFLISSYSGIRSDWYKTINRSTINPFVIGVLWIIATILSYGSVFMLWENVNPTNLSRDFTLSALFLISSFLSLLWATTLFQDNNIKMAVLIAAVVFLYQFWLTIYIGIFNKLAALFMIPLLVMYGYLFYSMLHLASINNIIL